MKPSVIPAKGRPHRRAPLGGAFRSHRWPALKSSGAAPPRQAARGLLPLKVVHEKQDEKDDQDDADDAHAAVTVAVTVAPEAAAEAAQQEDNEDDDKYKSHDLLLLWARRARSIQIETESAIRPAARIVKRERSQVQCLCRFDCRAEERTPEHAFKSPSYASGRAKSREMSLPGLAERRATSARLMDDRCNSHRMGEHRLPEQSEPFSVMPRHSFRHCFGCALVTVLMWLLTWPLPRLGAAAAPASATVVPGVAQPAPAATSAEYRRKLEEYTAARGKYEGEADAYWNSVAEKRRIRNAKRRADRDSQRICSMPPPRSICAQVYTHSLQTLVDPAKPFDAQSAVARVMLRF